MWLAKWQWNTQLPGVVGKKASDSDPPIGTTRMFCSGCMLGATTVSARAPPWRVTR